MTQKSYESLMIDISESMLVFDLDDTLYKERDYLRSGVISVSKNIRNLYGKDIEDQLLNAMHEKEDIWGLACKLLDLPLEVKDSFLWAYRLHCPNIEMDELDKLALESLASTAKGVAILTDGRSVSQRQKLKSLGLLDNPIYISQEHQSEKPSPERFLLIMKENIAKNYIYIGDNPKKDFESPNNLGWFTICLNAVSENIHQYDRDRINQSKMPIMWVNSLNKIEERLSKYA